jgi:hypothetical protein
MCGYDGIYYKHIIHGSDNILWALSRLFTAILITSHIPANMNKGVIITSDFFEELFMALEENIISSTMMCFRDVFVKDD